MIIKYCLPIIKTTKQEVLQALNTKGYDFYEVWLDYIKDLDEAFIKNLVKKLKDKLIIVFRRKNLEEMRLSFDERVKIISSLENSNSFLDLDITIQKNELDLIQKKRLKISTIVSYHSYQETPDDGKLKEIVDTMKTYDPAIFKIATNCNSPKDALRLLGLLLAMKGTFFPSGTKEKNIKYIILGMGKFGIITRIFGTLWGNQMIFAPKEKGEQSAPGQLTKKQLQSIFNILGER